MGVILTVSGSVCLRAVAYSDFGKSFAFRIISHGPLERREGNRRGQGPGRCRRASERQEGRSREGETRLIPTCRSFSTGTEGRGKRKEVHRGGHMQKKKRIYRGRDREEGNKPYIPICRSASYPTTMSCPFAAASSNKGSNGRRQTASMSMYTCIEENDVRYFISPSLPFKFNVRILSSLLGPFCHFLDLT